DRRRAEDRQRAAHPALRLERPMRQVAVEADGPAEPGQDVTDREHDQVAPAERFVPQLPAHDEEGHERDHGDRTGDDAVTRFVRDRLYVVNSRGHHGGGNPTRSFVLLPCRAFDRVTEARIKQCTTAVGFPSGIHGVRSTYAVEVNHMATGTVKW